MKKPAIKPMAHQKLSLKHARANPVVFDTSSPGTGKTAVRIWAFAERRRAGGGCALILAPKSLLKSAWADDFKKFAPDITTSVAYAENREEAFATEADAYITNVDAVKWLIKQKKPFWQKFDELIIDESPAYKHPNSQRSKAVASIADRFTYRACLTGTPNGNTILDVWHQVYLLDKGQRLGPSFYGFRNSVCAPKQVGRNPHAIQWADKEGAEEAVFGLINDITIRHKFEECVDIPATHVYTMDYTLTRKQRKAYDIMYQDQVLPMMKAGTITAVNAAAVTTKLQQIASGSVYDNDGNPTLIDTARTELVMDLVEARKHSLVFYLWDHQLQSLVKDAESRGISYAVINGSTSDKDRGAIVNAYQLGRYQVLFGHPLAVAHGLTLTRGTTTIWACPTPNLEWFEQGNSRQYRIGQKQKTEVIVILAEDTVEQRIYHEILMPKSGRMTTLLDLFATWK